MDTSAGGIGGGGGPTGPPGPQRAGEDAGTTSLGKMHISRYHHPPAALPTVQDVPTAIPPPDAAVISGGIGDAMALLASPLAADRPARQRALRRQQVARAWADPGTPAARCGTPRHMSGASIVAGPNGYHQILGLHRCRSAWACPVCTPALRWRQACVLALGLERAVAAVEGQVAMVTYTTPHKTGQPLRPLFKGVSAAWGHLVAGRRWQLAQRRMGVVGWVRGLEVTLGPNGWHPHLHVALVLHRGVDLDEVSSWLSERWATASAQAKLRDCE